MRFRLTSAFSPNRMRSFHSPVAQSVEQVAVNHWVGGSSPSRGARYASLANREPLLDSALPGSPMVLGAIGPCGNIPDPDSLPRWGLGNVTCLSWCRFIKRILPSLYSHGILFTPCSAQSPFWLMEGKIPLPGRDTVARGTPASRWPGQGRWWSSGAASADGCWSFR